MTAFERQTDKRTPRNSAHKPCFAHNQILKSTTTPSKGKMLKNYKEALLTNSEKVSNADRLLCGKLAESLGKQHTMGLQFQMAVYTYNFYYPTE